ncbi:MAG: nucleotidyltransferase domain-containing protein [Bryobacterales bacterium]|nr:nucleotidyltransferase domain-containing protein [Bryobacteraceae bacterium]MDW8355174.1 nucleotidyltransferase domain-containing protein [Bryobacterales bacterium]
MERVLHELVERLKKSHGDRLVSVVLYGSAAVGDHHGRYSDLNILCVLQRVTPRELGESAPVFRWWRALGNPAPLLLGRDEVRTSTDCFPIEFHDIQERRRVLYGEDVIAGLEIDDAFYRAQVEHELRAKLLRLRQKAAGVLQDKDLLRTLLIDSVSTFCILFRHALRLAGVSAAFEKRRILEQAQQYFGLDPTPFHRILDLREQKLKLREVEPLPLFEAYLRGIETVLGAVDRLER